jgi:orotidine-5'-phosphate decarboxylase
VAGAVSAERGSGPAVVPIVALDVPSAEAAARQAAALDAPFYKVGGELFTAAGPGVVDALRRGGAEVFLDLKFHDIPNTVRGSARSAAALGARLITVHASGGRAMLEAAVEGAGVGCGVLAVTVLTSLHDVALGAAWGRPIARVEDEVLRLAHLARAAGAHGVVCSGREAATVRAAHGDALAVLVPGVRPAGAALHDQARAVTPEEARAAGASYVVLGRAVSEAPDPRAALAAITRVLGG